MEFINVPINGNLDKFTAELIKLGFTDPQLIKENQIRLNGVFLEKHCDVYVDGTSRSQTVYKVTVNLPEEVRDSLELRFDKLQKLYSSMYGNGTSKYFQYRNSDRFLFNEPRRIRELSPGDFTRYTTDSGNIILEARGRFISITFLDKLNNEIQEKEMGGGKGKDINE